MKKLIEQLNSGKILVSDGAWGTELFKYGLRPGECPELWNIKKQVEVYKIAKSYVDAGADIIETNSFGGSSIKLDTYGLKSRAYEMNKMAAEISRDAAGDDVYVLGSMGPSGKLLIMMDVSEDELYESFSDQAKALEEGGADGIIIETMIDAAEMAVAVGAVRENTDLEIIASATYNKTPSDEFRTMMGASIDDMAGSAIDEGASIVGTNCGHGVDMMIEIVSAIRILFPDIPIIVQANAGMPEQVEGNGRLNYPESAEYMASKVGDLIDAGANIIGGCCGTSPKYIKQIKDAVRLIQS